MIFDVAGMDPYDSFFQRTVFPEKGLYPFIIGPRVVNALDNPLVTIGKGFMPHSGDDVCGKVRIVARRAFQQPAFTRYALVQPAAPGGIQDSDHGSYHPAFLDKFYLPVEYRRRIVISMVSIRYSSFQ